MDNTTLNDTQDIRLPNQRPTQQPPHTQAPRLRRQIGAGPQGAVAAPVQPPRVAIVGFSGRFPGADTAEQFWQLLLEERSSISELPYWHLPGIAERVQLRETFTCPGGFINDPSAFDADFFKISAREAEAMDPQHRLVLEQTWAAFEDAAICPHELRGSNTGVFIGISSADYNGLLARSEAGAHDATGNAHSIIANRISFVFDFHGPSAPIDTACSSSLVAVHRAAQSILNGDCTVAVAGGVNLCFEPMVFIGALKAGMLSPTGRCKAFAADADGYVRGEGVGVLILKDYQQALADGDNIVAAIIGSAENHGGHANSLTAPNPRAQADLIKQACRGIDINSIGYIEVHGTGTRLGDPIEISGLKQAFAELGANPEQRCYLGSVKTNIGHLESAAGIAGVIKTLLVLKQGYLPKSLHSEQLNPYIDLAGSPFAVLQTGREWPQVSDRQGQALPRRAGVSSFGFGGANAHVVLEAVEPVIPGNEPQGAASVFVLSAKTPEALQSRIEQLIDFVQRQPQLQLAELAVSLQLGREAMEYRCGFVAHSRDSLLSQLRDSGAGEGGPPAGKIAPETLHRALQQRDLGTLLSLWQQGATLDWRQLYEQPRPRRISLPTYPFSRERYWISEAPAASPTGAASLHPLVQRNTSDLAGQRFSSRFDGNEWFFSGHRVNGRKVLPGVAYLEMARAAVERSMVDADAVVALKHVAWRQPMVHDGGDLDIDIELVEQGEGQIRFEIRGSAADGPSYCTGVALVGSAERLVPLDLGTIAGVTNQQRLTPEQCYQVFGEMGLAYGESFRRINTLQAGNGQVLASLLRGEQAPGCELPPGLLDSALQAALGLALLEPLQAQREHQPLVPFALDRVVLGELDLLKQPCQAWVRYSADHQPGRINKLDLDICDEQGRIALRLQGFSSRKLAAEPPSMLAMTPVWRDKALIDPPQRSLAQQLIVLAGAQSQDLDLLTQRCQALVGNRRQIHIVPLPVVTQDPAIALPALAGFVIELVQKSPANSLVQLVLADLEHAGPVFASLLALLKTAKNEGLIDAAQCIELQGSLQPQWLVDNASQDDERVRYRDGQRQVASWQETQLAQGTAPQWREDGVYLLSGGTGGLGLLLAEQLARQGQGVRLILASRSAGQLSPEASQRVAGIRALGAQVQLHALDIADRGAVEALIAQCEQEWGTLNGIFHCAGITRDSLLQHKNATDLAAVLAPKVAGVLNLDRASAHLPLDCFVLYSSVSAVIGNPGQGDYALANAYMDEWAGWRGAQVRAGRRQGRTLAINWPLWRNGGLQIDGQREQQMIELTGIEPLSDSGGLGFLQQALAQASDAERWMVLEGDIAKIKRFIAGQWQQDRFEEPPAPQEMPAAIALAPSTPLAASVEGDLQALAIRYFKQLLSTTLKRPLEKIDSDASFERYGADSIMLTELTRQLERLFGSLPNTLLYEYQTVRELSAYFIGQHAQRLDQWLRPEGAKASAPREETSLIAEAPVRQRARNRQQCETPAVAGNSRDLAIIGISGRYPGAADLETFWHKLAGGEDLISEVPSARWDHQAYFDPARDRFDKTYCKWGGFLDGVEDFDPLFFNLSPREAHIINPNDRLFLETCWNLLESAGLTRQQIQQRYQQQVGVFVGVMYQQYQAFESDLVRESLVSVTSYSAIANRVSYFFDFQGPSLAIDTMCSSSISAIHAAGEALRNGDCRLAIAGGVNLTLHPKKYIGLSVGQVLGSHAGSRSFADGDGYLPAEGVGAVLLKTLADAERDGDPILAVIKSTAVNHGGHTHGFSVPSAKLQAALIDSNFKRAGIDPRTLSYVESAANGSAMGDAIELSALSRVFSAAGVAPQSCAIGSVKSNIGHAEAASGMSALSKLVLQLQHRQLAPSLLLGELNPKLDFAHSPFVLQRTLTEWPQPVLEIDGVEQPVPRRACLSAFGAGGSNAHLIIEEYSSAPIPDLAASEPGLMQIVPLSAHSSAALQQGLERLARHLDRHPQVRLQDLAHTLQNGREAMPLRLALRVSSTAQLRGLLAEILQRLQQGQALASLDGTDLPLALGNVDEVPAALASLLSGPGAAALSAGLIAAADLQQLALLWTQGGEIPWHALGHNTGAALIPLPTYAFDKQRYWLEQPSAVKALHEPLTAAGSTRHVVGQKPSTAAEQGRQLLADLLGMQPQDLSPSKPLSAYGADSIVMLQWAMQVQAQIDPGLALADIQQCQTLGDVLQRLSRDATPASVAELVLPAQILGLLSGSTTRFPELQRLNPVQQGRPVFWFHGALGGSEIYQGLAQHIQRPFFGLQARGWMTDRAPLQGIQAMAAYYVQVIQSVQPQGPYDLGGYSLGGMLAYEVTRQLQELGETVISLVMLDSPDVTGERSARLADKTRLLQTVNMSLQMTLGQTPERFAEVLIHRDEIDLALSPADYLQQLTDLARQRGLKTSDQRLQQLMAQVTQIQQAYQVEHYRIQPLPRAAEVACYYFRNASGLWMGDLEPFFSTDSQEFAAFNHADYWQEWQRQLPNFEMIEVASANHMTLLTQPEVFRVIAQFCATLYGQRSVENAVG